MDIAQVMNAVDNPELLVAGSEIENFLVLGKNDKRRESELGADLDDVLLRIFDDPSGRVWLSERTKAK
jgi:hypothetical protein